MRVPDEVRECVAFIAVAKTNRSGEQALAYSGTGFFAAIHNEGDPPNTGFPYFVTARHVADRLTNREFFIRLNRHDGTSGLFLGRPGLRWYVHPSDINVDLAVLPLSPPEAEWQYKVVPHSIFATDEEIKRSNIGPGDEVFITGLFSHVYGSARNIPIVRTGNLAMIPGERIPTTGGDQDAYLIEARSLGGVSGSPVFVRETISLDVHRSGMTAAIAGTGRFFLLGVMHGHWDIPVEMKDDIADDANGRVNMGIAIVIPARLLLEVLQQPELAEARRLIVEQARENERKE